MLTLRKTRVKDPNPVFHVPSSQPVTDLVTVPYFASRPLAKVSEETPTQHLFPLQSRMQGSSRKHAELLTS